MKTRGIIEEMGMMAWRKGSYLLVYVAFVFFALAKDLPAKDHASGKYRSHALAVCEWCGATNNLEVHHVITQSEILERNLSSELYDDDPDNFVTLCRDCHFVVGHRRDWKRYNHAIKAMILLLKTEEKAYVITNKIEEARDGKLE